MKGSRPKTRIECSGETEKSYNAVNIFLYLHFTYYIFWEVSKKNRKTGTSNVTVIQLEPDA